MRSGRGHTELVDRRLQVTDHKKYGVEFWDELLLGGQHGERAGHPHKVVLKERAALAVYSWWVSVEGGFGEDDMAPRCSLRGMCEVWSNVGGREDFGR